ANLVGLVAHGFDLCGLHLSQLVFLRAALLQVVLARLPEVVDEQGGQLTGGIAEEAVARVEVIVQRGRRDVVFLGNVHGSSFNPEARGLLRSLLELRPERRSPRRYSCDVRTSLRRAR